MTAESTSVRMKGFVVWLCIIAAETIHGIARRLLLEPLVGDLRARQVSVFIGSLIILSITFVFVRWLKGSRTLHFILTGVMWVTLTVAFEVLLGRFVMGVTWERIGSDYNIAAGGRGPDAIRPSHNAVCTVYDGKVGRRDLNSAS